MLREFPWISRDLLFLILQCTNSGLIHHANTKYSLSEAILTKIWGTTSYFSCCWDEVSTIAHQSHSLQLSFESYLSYLRYLWYLADCNPLMKKLQTAIAEKKIGLSKPIGDHVLQQKDMYAACDQKKFILMAGRVTGFTLK